MMNNDIWFCLNTTQYMLIITIIAVIMVQRGTLAVLLWHYFYVAWCLYKPDVEKFKISDHSHEGL